MTLVTILDSPTLLNMDEVLYYYPCNCLQEFTDLLCLPSPINFKFDVNLGHTHNPTTLNGDVKITLPFQPV